MYRLTPRMLQRLERDLSKCHDLFDGGGCSGWELEELLVRAIKADTPAQHQVKWKEKGHDAEVDFIVQENGDQHFLQVKSGEIQKRNKKLKLSGHRLGRFRVDFEEIGNYPNRLIANFVSGPYRQINDSNSRRHICRLCYVDAKVMTGLRTDEWQSSGTCHTQTNSYGV